MATLHRIRDVRLARGVTQTELARRMGISQSSVCRLERPSRNVSVRMLRLVADALDCEVGELLDA
jgi:transcriptional regulator with XRE-family HTH domain